MNPPRRLRGAFGMCNLREGFVNLREGFVVAPWRLREAFSKTRSAKASRSPLEGFAKASRRRHGRLHLETIRQIMTSPLNVSVQYNGGFLPEIILLTLCDNIGVNTMYQVELLSFTTVIVPTFPGGCVQFFLNYCKRSGLTFPFTIVRHR